jgi:RsiW-degrading membrane proteinase PrsW (M82 family)
MAWRARTHYLTRNPAFLLKACLLILGVGLLLAITIVQLSGGRGDTVTQALVEEMVKPGEAHLRGDYLELERAVEPAPRKLAKWMRRLSYQQRDGGAEGPLEGEAGGSGFDLDGLLAKHVPEVPVREVFEAYRVVALGAVEDGGREDARRRLLGVAEASSAVPLANQLLGQWLVQQKRLEEGMLAFVREGKAFAEAAPARAEALHWAVHLKQVELVKELLRLPGWAEGSDPAVVYHAAAMAGEVWLQWRTLVQLRLKDLPLLKLGLAALAIGLWYVILVKLSGLEGRWKWALPLLPLAAGVASIWPTLSLVEFQHHQLGLRADAPFPHNLWYYFGGVGLREELCKLALFLPFLPWLLKKKQPGLALVVGAFVGLGFALEENLDYYDAAGGSVVWGRFITANFMHASMTGIAAHGLYLTVRSRFHRVDHFVTAFLTVVAAHGLYDLVILEDHELLGMSFLHIVVLAFLANQFFTLLAQDSRPARGAVSPAAVYLLGSAVLVAALLVTAASVTGTMEAVALVGQGCLGVVPVGFLFWRHLH